MNDRKVLLGGCALVLALVAAIVGLGLWLWSELARGDADAGDPPDEPVAEERREREGGYLSRSERRELEARLERVESDLEFARGQVFAESTSAATRAAWRERVAELEGMRDELRAKLR